MKRVIHLVSATLVLLLIVSWTLDVRSQQSEAYVAGEVIIKIKASVPDTEADAIATSLGAFVDRRFESTGAELWSIQGMTVPEAVSLYQGDERVLYIEPNYIVYATDLFPNDPRFNDLWGLHNTGQTGGTPDADIDAPEAWSVETGDTVLVGVIDTGVDWTHPDLAAHIWTNPGEIAGNGVDDDGNGYIDDTRGWDFVNNDNNPMDDHSHGTHVSGTIAGIGNNGIGVVGVSWSARIMPLKFLDAGGSGSTADAIDAVDYATMMGARLTNNSWGGGGFSQALKDAIVAAGAAGYLFVAAAGNTGQNSDAFPHYPASYDLDNIISVANTTPADGLNGGSTYGLVTVDLGAPGTSILSTTPGNGYGVKSGTSMASPHVAGAVSLLWSAAPAMGHMKVKDVIMSSVDLLPSLAGKTVSGGRLNVNNMLEGLDSIPPDPVLDLAVGSTGSNTAMLVWTATGDDSSAGTASIYDMRYSTSPIDELNFEFADQVMDEPPPQPSGSPESHMVTGLDFTTQYYFALRVLDEQLNASTISNVPRGTTLGIPKLSVSDVSFADTLATGGSSTQMMTISNDAVGTLDFNFTALPLWLQPNPVSGRVLEGESMDVEIVFDATRLFTGLYTADVILENNDPTVPMPAIAVSLRASSAPDIVVSDEALDFGAHLIGESVADTIEVANIGALFLNVSGVSTDAPEFSVDTSGFLLGLNDSRELVVNFAPTSLGVTTGTLTITSDDPDQPTVLVSLTGEGVEPPIMGVSPLSLSENLLTGQTSDQALTISNTGGSDLEFGIIAESVDGQAHMAQMVTSLNIPASAGDYPRGTSPPSIGLAPLSTTAPSAVAPNLPLASGGSAFGTVPVSTSTGFATRFSLSMPEVLNPVGDANQAIWAGDFGLGDNSFAYAVNDLNQFMRIDTLDGTQTVLGTLTPFGGETFTGMAVDPTDGRLYATSTDIGNSSLYLIDPDAVTATRVGAIGFSGVIAVAVDDAGVMYAHDIVSDELLSIDKTTGQGTAIGLLGFDANFGQGMSFDGASGELYLAAFNNSTFQGELRIADRTTGATTLVGLLGSSTPGGTVQVGWVAVPVTGLPQLSVSPSNGVVPAGLSMDVTVRFDATGLEGGAYDGNLVISSNEPASAEVTVPASLGVTSATDIAVGDTELDYGEVFVGESPSMILKVRNAGVLPLAVTNISSDNGDYSVNMTTFGVNPGESQDVLVTFSPLVVGASAGTLTISSNDPDEPTVTVALSGSAAVAPAIAVSPTSLTESLLTGATSEQQLTIDNSAGGRDLLWSARVATLPGTAQQSYTLTDPAANVAEADGGEVASEGRRTTSITAALEDLTGVKILYDQAHGQPSSLGWSVIIADVVARGAIVDVNTSTITPAQLSDYNVFWTTDISFPWGATELTALTDWVMSGGGLVLEGDNTSTVPIYNTLLAALGAGMEFSTTDGASGTTTNIYPHETTDGVTSIMLSANIGHISTVLLPAHKLVDDVANVTNSAYSEVGSGRIVAMADEVMSDSRMGVASNQLFANQVFDWTASAVRWLSVAPDTGTVAAGASEDVTVTFDAPGLEGGGYDANIIISSNDPANPELTVPAHLQVSGAQDIEVSETAIDFGTVFAGAGATRTLVVTNVGVQVLAVTGITSDNGDYTVDVTTAVLNPGESQDIEVTFLPPAVGASVGTLTIASNDPDDPSVTVALSGDAVEPPIIAVAPSSLADSLVTGQSSTHLLTISNTGGSDLDFAINAQDGTAVSLVPDRGIDEPRIRWTAAPTPTGDSRAEYEQVSISPTHPALSTIDPAVLVIQDFDAWGLSMGVFISSQFGISTTTINSSFIASVDFTPYDVVITCGSQSSSYYSAVSANVSKFEAYVAAGGVVQYQAATQGDNVAIVGGVNVVYGGSEQWNTNVLPGHPIMDGLPLLLEGSAANHGTLANLPGSAQVLTTTTNSGLPTTVEYGWGAGTVIATGMTWEYLWVNGFNSGPMLYNAVAYALSGAGSWLSADPASGTVPPGGSVDVAVVFDAGGLAAGAYEASLIISSNDPSNSELAVPAHLQMTGAPDIALSETSLDFGTIFVGESRVATMLVANEGVELLVVTSITSDNPDYSPDLPGFVLNPGESRGVQVTFMPAAAGASAGALTIASNDPDEPSLTVALSGEAVGTPVIALSPTLLSESLHTGGTSTQQLTIDNSAGGSSLLWSARVAAVTGTAMQSYTLTPPEQDVAEADGGQVMPDLRTTAITATLNDLTGVRIVYDISHGQSNSSPWSTIVADLTLRGATVDENSSPLTDALLANYDVFWTTDISTPWSPSELNALTGWILTGGGLILEGDNTSTVPIYNSLLSAVGAGIVYSTVDGASGMTTNIYPHETTVDVTSISLSANVGHISSVVLPAHVLIDDIVNVTNTAYSEVAFGRVMAMADEVFSDSRMGVASNQLFANQVFDWMATGVGWLSIDPDTGTVAAGTSVDVPVAFDAAGLEGGGYVAELVVTSNDPVAPNVGVAAHLDVIGAPDIAVSETAIDFGTVFVGASPSVPLVVTNEGVELLTVSAISSDNGDFATDVTNFNLSPGAIRVVQVTFSPTATGASAGTLTIISDDPDEPLVAVAVSGAAAEPPVMAVSPSSINDDLFTGQTSFHLLTIANSGLSDLEFTASVVNTEGPSAAANVVVMPSPADAAAETKRRSQAEQQVLAGDYEGEQAVNSMGEYLTGPPRSFEFVSQLSSLSVLYFTDLFSTPERAGEQALVNLGVTFAMYVDDYNGFLAELATGAWDVVLYESAGNPRDITPLASYIAGGGKLISSYWAYDAVFATAMEAAYVSSVFTPLEVTRWSNHAIFSSPNSVPDLVPGPDDAWNDNGDRFDPVGGAVALAGYTPAQSPGESAIIVGNDGNTILNGFIFEDYLPIDDDGDGKADVVELVENEILYLGRTWLTVAPSAAVVPPTVEYNIQVTFNAAELLGGNYSGDIVIASNDPANPETIVPANLHVTGVPDIVVLESSFDYGPTYLGGVVQETLHILNIGTDELIVTWIAADMPDYSALPETLTLAIGDTAEVAVSFMPTSIGLFPSRLTIESNDFDEPAVTLPLSGEGILPPDIAVTPSALHADLFVGEAQAQQIKIDNSTGQSDLTWEIFTLDVTYTAAAPSRRDPYVAAAPAADHSAQYKAYAGTGPDPDYHSTVLPATDPRIIAFNQLMQAAVADGRIVFNDDMESGANGWIHYSTHANGIDQWQQTNGRSSSPNTSWQVTQHAGAGGDALQSPLISIPAGVGATLMFQHWYNFDDCENPDNEPDGGIVEISADGGVTWQQIFPITGYPYTLDDICSNPLAFYEAYAHDGGDGVNFIPAVFDLSAHTDSDVSLRFHAGWDCGNCTTNEGWYIDDVTVVAEGAAWLTVEPSAGTLPAGAHQMVDVMFDASEVLGGGYSAQLVVASNDPVLPEAAVSVTMHVTGAPDISVSETSMDFGAFFVGLSMTDTLAVSNTGTDVLIVNNVSTDNADYTVGMTAFAVNPGQSRGVEVTFTPSGAGVATGALTIASNDPDEPSVAVSLTGEGIDPPVIAVSPDSLYEELATGEASTQILTVDNSAGGSPLVWSARTMFLDATQQTYTLTIPEQEATTPDDGPPPENIRSTAITATLDDLSDVRIIYDSAHGQIPPTNWSTIIADLTLRGATVDVNTSSLTPALLANYQVFWTTDISIAFSAPELSALTTWLTNGGGMVLEGDNPASVSIYNTVLSAAGAGIVYSATRGASGFTPIIYPHETTQGVTGIFLNANTAILSTVVLPAHRLVDDFRSLPNTAYSKVGMGRIVAAADEIFANDRMGRFDNQLFANQVFDWVSVERWLSMSPHTGTVPAGNSVAVTMTFDAEAVLDGTYQAVVEVSSNDPVAPQVDVPATLVVGTATILTSADNIPFRYALHDNYPNPFNPATTIQFDLPEQADVQLEVYNVKGQRVVTLVNGVRSAGSYSVGWDGRSTTGGRVATGVYFYRLRAGDFVQTKKMVLMK